MIFIAYFDKLADSTLIVVKHTIRLRQWSIAVQADPLFDLWLVLVLALNIDEALSVVLVVLAEAIWSVGRLAIEEV